MNNMEKVLKQIESNEIEILNMKEKLNVCHGFIEDISRALRKNKSIIIADLSNNSTAFYYPDERIFLINSLQDNKSIRCLDLSHNRIGWGQKGDINALCELIKHNDTIRELNLEGNFIYSGFNGREIIYKELKFYYEEMLLAAILQNDTIIHLNISRNGIDSEYENKILVKIENNRKLRPLMEQTVRFINTNKVYVPEWFPHILLNI